jgi:hypothetical protein
VAHPIVIPGLETTMKTKFSPLIDNLIVLAAALFLAVVIVWGFDYMGYRYPWLENYEAPGIEDRRELRSYV